MSNDDLPGWSFEVLVRERSAGVYEGAGTHLSGASVRAIGTDPEDHRLRKDARDLLQS